MTNRFFSPIFLALLLAPLAVACGDDGGDGGDGGIDAPTGDDASPIDAADGACRDATTCGPNESCYGPNDTACGIPPQEGCANDQDCVAADDVCHAIYDSCSPDRVGAQCGQPCTPGEACGDGFLCNAEGACRPVACDSPDYECAPSQLCDTTTIDATGPVHGITHGCATIACQDDGPCQGDTVCVNGYCQDALGTCQPPAP